MKIVGLVAEYNPFHNGHLYHIQKAKELTGADAVLIVMSGNYVQRGAPAVMPKHLRAQMALESGADAVVELPACYATGSAEYFAAGAVSTLNRLGCIDSICFGSECGDYESLRQIAEILSEEPGDYKNYLKKALREGHSFPKSRQMALNACLRGNSSDALLLSPNNILGIEYAKALYRQNSHIKGYTIKRRMSGYHDIHLSEGLSSASAIRRALTGNDGLHFLKEQVPPSSYSIIKDAHGLCSPVCADDFSLLLKYRLLTETADSLTCYMDVTEDLANRIMNHINEFTSISQFCQLMKTKDMTYARISRSLFHILLGITYEQMQESEGSGICQYVRILGFRKDSSHVLSFMKKHAQIPLITKLTQADSLSGIGGKMLRQDIFASDLYESVVTDKFGTPFINEYQKQLKRI